MRKNWIVKDSDSSIVQAIAAAVNVSELTAKILYHRGIRDAQSAKNFMEPEAAPFNDPFIMKTNARRFAFTATMTLTE